MNLTTYSFTLDIHTTNSQINLMAKQFDSGRKILVTLSEKGKFYEIAKDCFAVFRAVKPDGTVLYNNCKIINNEIQYVITDQTLAEVGIVDCEITLYDSDGIQITAPNFTIQVTSRIQSDEAIESSNEFTALQAIISEVNEILGSIGTTRIVDVDVLAANWVGDATLYSQVVQIDAITPYSQVNLTPSAEQLAIFYEKDLAFVTENEDGVITIYAIGEKPQSDYTIQATIMEVAI